MKRRGLITVLVTAALVLAVGGWIVQGVRGAFRPLARLRPRFA